MFYWDIFGGLCERRGRGEERRGVARRGGEESRGGERTGGENKGGGGRRGEGGRGSGYVYSFIFRFYGFVGLFVWCWYIKEGVGI